ncbi:nuclear transport factor 2 family protein [Pedobacter sp. SYSU D00535]|uniref:nuclear transport factor 2 family protein n=1 Tax=Pedobacter sp. SYSU D00535 TaxID=2810308 RepID=UPI001F609691|nr:nuclear transport factor 2 family protein [Pedobacter sp. SYSU D00535]
MKTLKTFAAALLMALSFSVFASDEPNNQKLSMDYAVKAYIDAVSHGKIKGLSEVLDNDVKFTVTRGENIINYSKSEMLNSMKGSQNLEQNCQTDYSVMELNGTQAVVKVTMKYEAFSKVNIVTLANTTKGWKITNVSSSFV